MSQTKLINPVKGTRDFYPDSWDLQKWLSSKWLNLGNSYGYQEYEGPILEPIELYLEKSSQEIIEKQTFSLTDRGGETLIMRPELTPTLARLVSQKEGQLVFPLRWQSYGRFWRYEKPQRGRGREFFQWNIDLLGAGSPLIDAELLTIAAASLKTVGITPQLAKIKVNNRQDLEVYLSAKLSTNPDLTKSVIKAIDKIDKLDPSDFSAWLTELGLTTVQIETLYEALANTQAGYSPALTETLSYIPEELRDYFEIDLKIVRGFDYYTGLVLEAWATTGLKRALFGGGRYDNLTSQVGGSRAIPGVGFAIGDMPILELLGELKLLPDLNPSPAAIMVTVFSPQLAPASFALADKLRNLNLSTLLYPSPDKLPRQFKYASSLGIPFVAVIGPTEIKSDSITVKNMVTGEQKQVTIEEIPNFF